METKHVLVGQHLLERNSKAVYCGKNFVYYKYLYNISSYGTLYWISEYQEMKFKHEIKL